MDIREFLKNNIVVLDGATGSLLQKAGLPVGKRPELWNLENPEALISIHRSYFDAGSNIVCANTFGANIVNFDYDLLESIIKAAIDNVRIAAERSSGIQPKFVSFDLGPIGKLLKPLGDVDFEEAVRIFSVSARLAEKYGADLISIETMNDGYETKAAVLAVKESCSLPLFVSNAYNEDDNLFTGASPEAMVAMLEGLGADAIGLNCSFGPEKLMNVLKRMLSVSSVPVIFKPNAGMPRVSDGVSHYDVGPEEFSRFCSQAVDLGARLVGGCCGTSPEYISKLNEFISGKCPRILKANNSTIVSSGIKSVEFSDKTVLVGERINPTGKKLIKEALKNNDIDFLLNEAIEQDRLGVDILDVNCGLPDICEKDVLPEVVSRIQQVTDLPLQIDTSDPEAMEKSLRIYNGKPVINSVNGKKESLDSVLPLVKKYGGVVVCLTLDENGIPSTAEERLGIAERIIAEAGKYGIARKNLVFDPLALTVSADPSAAKETLKAVRLITEKTGCKTILGISNVSFGLPSRDLINASFLTLAMNEGLGAAIINPKSMQMMNSYYSYNALNCLDDNFENYISKCVDSSFNVSFSAADDSSLETAIVQGRKEKAAELTRHLLETIKPLDIISEFIIPGLNKIGEDFENKRAFLPQLLMSAEAAKNSFDVIKSSASANSVSESKGKIILATVKGDVHDIGKNIVKLLLENYGYDVIDLGKDVDPETVLNTALDNNVKLVGLSALMTTTVPSMKDTIELLHSKCHDCRIIVGGAVLNEEYAKQINADYYAKDAMDTVKFAEKYFDN